MTRGTSREFRLLQRKAGPCSACGDGDTAMKYHTYDPPPPSYTLAELEALAREWRDNMNLKNIDENGDEDDISIPLVLSVFLGWLKKREREVSDGA